MLHKKFNQNLSTFVLYVKNRFTLSKKKCLRFNIILKLITCWEINQVTSKCQMKLLGNTIRKRSKTEKKDYHHRILHIQISLGSKFQFQQTILIF